MRNIKVIIICQDTWIIKGYARYRTNIEFSIFVGGKGVIWEILQRRGSLTKEENVLIRGKGRHMKTQESEVHLGRCQRVNGRT